MPGVIHGISRLQSEPTPRILKPTVSFKMASWVQDLREGSGHLVRRLLKWRGVVGQSQMRVPKPSDIARLLSSLMFPLWNADLSATLKTKSSKTSALQGTKLQPQLRDLDPKP